MPSYDPTIFNVSPYHDDFNEEKKFLRMLFRPGYAVQSRELTQLQTILQNQIERFGNHVFKDGSNIIGGEISTQTLNFVRVEPTTISTPTFDVSSEDIVGHRLIQRDSFGNTYTRAVVVDYLPSYAPNDQYGIAVVSYLSGNVFTAGATLSCDNPDKSFTVKIPVGTPIIPSLGTCKVVSVSQGIYYIDGFFVRTEDQLEPAYNVSSGIRNFSSPTGVMGFDVVSEIISEAEDYTLKDPANGSYNYNAPGSHRYKINLNLAFSESGSIDDFIELVAYESGQITRRKDNTQYSDLMKLFAQRTYDESGNYITKPFDIYFRDGGSTYVYADIGSGKAYAFGYEYETKFKETLRVPRALVTKSYSDVGIENYFGHYIVGKYNPSTGDSIVSLYSDLRTDEASAAIQVYGATQAATPSTYGSVVIFDGLLVSAYPVGITNISSQDGNTLTFNAHIVNWSSPNLYHQNLGGKVNLYSYSPSTGTSTKLLSDITLYRDGITYTNIVNSLPLFYDRYDKSLLFPVNGKNPTTMVKTVQNIDYTQDVFRGFVVDSTNQYPRVALKLGVNYNWCFGNGFIPNGTDVGIDEEDGYYVVYVSGTSYPVGTLIRIVADTTTVPADKTKVTARISGDGDSVQFTSLLPTGSYYLVGKAKSTLTNVNVSTSQKTRTKTKATATETITDGSVTLNTFKRVISRNTANDIVQMYFILDKSDVYKIDSIVSANGVDVSNEFMFDNGQRQSAYMLARLYVKPEYFSKYEPSKAFQITTTYSYYEHSGYGPFISSSYVGVSYDDIPSFVTTGEDKKTINLANALDYRYQAKIIGYAPSSATAGSQSSATPTNIFNAPIIRYVNGFVPEKNSIITDHESYLPRIDKLIIPRNSLSNPSTQDTVISRIEGVPSDTPLIPEDAGDSMTLFVLSVPAYTFNGTDIKAESVKNNRFTMKDVGDISSRVDMLEQTTVLNDLEMSVISMDMTNSAGEDAIKRAILIDTFNGHSVGDVSHSDYRCSIDAESGDLRPGFDSTAYGFAYSGSDPGITRTSDNIVCFDYSGVTLLYQDKSSGTVPVNVFALPSWIGVIKATPYADYWFDRTSKPIVKSNVDNVNDAWFMTRSTPYSSQSVTSFGGHGFYWNDWESIWNGISTELTDAESQKNAQFFSQTRGKNYTPLVENIWYKNPNISRDLFTLDELQKKYYSSLRKNDNYVDVGSNTIINNSVVPYMRGKSISFNVYNMKPNTKVHVFVDNVNVDQYCSLNGITGQFTTSEADGSLEGMMLTIPSGMFETGDKIIRVADVESDLTLATTIAETTFYSRGTHVENPYGIYSVRPVEIRKQSPNSSRVVSNPLYRKKNINVSKYDQWIDPLAQTFTIDENENPNGIYLEAIDLFFATKDDSLPVTVEICPVIYGIPHTSVVLPFSTVVKKAANVVADSSTPTATSFKFSSPVYLYPGEYAIVVRTNSLDYSLFVADIGGEDITTGTRISSTFQGGVLFKAQNSSEPSGSANTDLMFTMKRCKFEVPSSGLIPFSHVGDGKQFISHLVQPNVFAFTPTGTQISAAVVLGADKYDATINRNLKLNQSFVIDDASTFDLSLSTTLTGDDRITPIIDLDRTNVIAVRNLTDGGDSSTTTEEGFVAGRKDSTSRYMTKRVVIPEGKTAKELKVIIDANIPRDTFIRIYGKALLNDNAYYESGGYFPLEVDTSGSFYVGGQLVNSVDDNDYRQLVFSGVPDNTDGTDVFDVFSIKICLHSNNPIRVPKVRNLRVIAVE